MPSLAGQVLLRQFDIAWALASLHLDGLTTEACLWRPADKGLHVWPGPGGVWRADWPVSEAYDIGPSSIGWMTWHWGYWLSMALDHGFGEGGLDRDQIAWPGDGPGATAWIRDLACQWRAQLERLTDQALISQTGARWPFADRPFIDVVAWANVELTKSAAEIGYARFLFAARDPSESTLVNAP